MKPASFEYHAPESLADVTTLLAEHGDEAKVLAGGQSLVPMLALRLTRFEHIIDLNRVDELCGVERKNGTLTVRSMTRQSAVEHDAAAGEAVPLLAEAIPLIGHFQIRNRGTVGGSIAHADPASELPAVALALDAELEVDGRERHPPRPRRRLLRRHVDDDHRRRRDPQRGALPRVVGPSRVRGRGGRPAQRRLRPGGRRCRRSSSTMPVRWRARRSRSSAWRRHRCAPAPPSRRSTARRRRDPSSPRSHVSRSVTPNRLPTSTRRPSTANTSARTSWSVPSTEPWEQHVVADHAIKFTVNGQVHSGHTEARKTLADYLREDCGLTGTHLGCEHGVCGACTILVDGEAVRSCLMFAVQAEGADITTIEGIGPPTARSVRCRRRSARPTASSAGSARPASSSACTRSCRRTRAPRSTRSARACRATCAGAPGTRESSRRCRSLRSR